MGLFKKLLGAADPVTGRGMSADPRLKGSGRGRTPRPVRGKVPPGNSRFGIEKGRANARGGKAGRGRAAPAPGGLGRLLGSLTGRH